MRDINYWKRNGFKFEARYPNEYDLWVNWKTMQKLRRYVDGKEWVSDHTGEYELVEDEPTEIDPNKIWIKINSGNVFEGTLEQFKDCFFDNATPETVADWSRENGWDCVVTESPPTDIALE